MSEHQQNTVIVFISTILGMSISMNVSTWLNTDPIGKITMSTLTGAAACGGGLLVKWAVHKISRRVKEYYAAMGET